MTRWFGAGLVVVIAITISTVVPVPAAFAASDPLAVAQAKITAAQGAADKAAGEYDTAQSRYYELQADARRTGRRITSLREEVSRLLTVVRKRAVVTYMGGSPGPLDGLLVPSSDVLAVARRAVLVNSADAASNVAVGRFQATTDDLGALERSLRVELDRQAQVLRDLRDRRADVQRALDDATRAERALRVQLQRERRVKEYAALVRQAQANARARAQREAANAVKVRDPQAAQGNVGGAPTGGGAGQIVGAGSWVCPVQGGVSFTDTYGAPRSGGRSHKGVDMFAARGTPTVAVVAGSVFFQSDPLGGLAAYVNGNDGNTYYYAHLNDYVGGGRSVAAGEVVGHVGNTGDASDAPPHLHFEIRPGGPNGPRINPYPTVRAHC